jgi:hypothetical protein
MTPNENDAAPTGLAGTTGSECLSCVGCKWLYQEGTGYSNYTWENDDVRCALDRNPNLTAERPSDWNQDAATDNWPATNRSRCDRYAPGEYVALDVDGEDGPADKTTDEDQIRLICEHSGRKPHGYA